jgi:fructose-1,6-bisphosphatase I
MITRATLSETLHGAGHGKTPAEIKTTILALAEAAVDLSDLIAGGNLRNDLGASSRSENASGDAQKEIDRLADEILLDACRSAPVAYVASEEQEAPTVLDRAAPLAVALDPLDGSSSIDSNISIGTIFSILPAKPEGFAEPLDAFLQPGTAQLAAGFIVYGPQTALVLAVETVEIFIFDRDIGEFIKLNRNVAIANQTREYAINASNYWQWGEPIRSYIDDCLRGKDGPLRETFNMRWIASLVAEAYRILVRGGIFLYPQDQRPGYENGRLRLVYEANPIAFIVERAKGAATNGVRPILDLRPLSLHQRTPLVFGASDEVRRVAAYHDDDANIASRSPLFSSRGLLRA